MFGCLIVEKMHVLQNALDHAKEGIKQKSPIYFKKCKLPSLSLDVMTIA